MNNELIKEIKEINPKIIEINKSIKDLNTMKLDGKVKYLIKPTSFIELKKILYVEGLKDYVKIYIEDELHPILSLMSLKSLEEKLPSSQFIRVHRSFIVQLSQIKVIERNRIVFGKQYIPISDSYKNTFSEYLNQRQPNSK